MSGVMRPLQCLVYLGLLCLLTACTTSPNKFEEESQQLVRDYLISASASEQGPTGPPLPIQQISVRAGSELANTRVDAHLERASIREVVHDLLAQADVPADLGDLELHGLTTALFFDLSLLEALNVVLAPARASVQEQEGRLIFSGGVHLPPPPHPSDSTGSVRAQMSLRHVQSENALEELANISTTGALSASSMFGSNDILLSGPPEEVLQALALLGYIDQPRPHVIIEAMVVELDSFEFERFGARLAGIAGDAVSDGVFSPGSFLSEAISFSYLRGSDNTEQLSAFIDLLVEHDRAYIISRPYAATLTHQEANIEIAQERYVVIEEEDNARSIRPITAGISLNVMPKVLANGIIRVALAVEASEFLASTSSTVVVEKSVADTTVDVRSGQTIVIGGLYRRTRVLANAGLPGLRNIPGLNFFTSSRLEESLQTEVMIYLTPHIWWPGQASPVHEVDSAFDQALSNP